MDDPVNGEMSDMMTNITAKPFGMTADGRPVTVFHMENAHQMAVDVLDYGCTIRKILVPDAEGRPVDVVLGYDKLEDYEKGSCFFGTFVGRYANRIKGAQFDLNGRTYHLPENDGKNHLHGLFSRMVFESRILPDGLEFTYLSPDGEEGFPGNLKVTVLYRLLENDAVEMTYTAETDADTVLNLTNHSYFNLDGCGDVLNHRLQLAADRYTEADEATIATGRILPVAGSALDFRKEKSIGEGLAEEDTRVKMFLGYDHNYLLEGDGSLQTFAVLKGGRSGICMEAQTTQPGVQLYTGNYVDTDAAPCGKGGVRYPRHGGVCLETQHYPCSPNYKEFPGTVLHPGETFCQQTVYRFYHQPDPEGIR